MYESEPQSNSTKTRSLEEIEHVDQSLEVGDNPPSVYLAIRVYPKIVGYTLGLCIAVLLFGYDNVIVSSVSAMPGFQIAFGDYHNDELIIPSSWLGVWTAASPIGLVFGAAAGGWFQNRYGRRMSLLFGNLVVALGIAICFVSNRIDDKGGRRGVYLVGKLMEGFGVGTLVCATQTWISEVAPVTIRAFLLCLIPTFTLFGQLIGSGVVFALLAAPADLSYTIAFASQWPFSIVLFPVALLLPESPVHLIRKGQEDAARKAYERLYSARDAADAIETFKYTIQHERASNGGRSGELRDCFTGHNRRRTWLVLFSYNVPQFFGITLLANASYFMQTVGMEASQSLMFLVIGIGIGIVANLLSIWTLARFRRRTLLVTTLFVTVLLWVSVGIAGCFVDSSAAVWYIAACMMVIIFVCGCGAWPASVVVASETSSLQLRGFSQSLGWLSQGVVSGVFSIVLPYIYNTDEGDLRGRTGFILAVLAAAACVISWLCVPEMKGLTTEDIDLKFEQLMPARQF
ncbi:putative sugar transporter [Colletotrichum acutatum]|uniref:Sugar transporter n=1 Tax=Glomerella acutata TaxID=27357 RepID=A0AAD8XE39_GLOAC|nr:putative sugar transporter [Colletotrichum acutatum]KAK1722956.1 putative sugar transporter [Colletotrichum acutatum]